MGTWSGRAGGPGPSSWLGLKNVRVHGWKSCIPVPQLGAGAARLESHARSPLEAVGTRGLPGCQSKITSCRCETHPWPQPGQFQASLYPREHAELCCSLRFTQINRRTHACPCRWDLQERWDHGAAVLLAARPAAGTAPASSGCSGGAAWLGLRFFLPDTQNTSCAACLELALLVAVVAPCCFVQVLGTLVRGPWAAREQLLHGVEWGIGAESAPTVLQRLLRGFPTRRTD